jgi:hypothetical protein
MRIQDHDDLLVEIVVERAQKMSASVKDILPERVMFEENDIVILVGCVIASSILQIADKIAERTTGIVVCDG